jgi:general nucleoside transport system permease protein
MVKPATDNKSAGSIMAPSTWLRWGLVRRCLQPLGVLGAALAVALLCGMILGLVVLHQPFAMIMAVWRGAWGTLGSATTTLAKTSPLLLTGLAVAIAYRTGLLNIGCEGQLTVGALAAATIAVKTADLPAMIAVPLALAGGGLAGGIWAAPAVWLRQRRGVHEVITTLLLNYAAIHLAEYLVRGPLGDGSAMGRTPMVPPQAVWPALVEVGAVGVTAAPLVALALTILAQGWFALTIWGYEATAVGSNRTAAAHAGIDADRWRTRMFVTSGALAGLAGTFEVLAVHHRFYAAFSPGYGFDGITVAFLVNGSPGWLWVSSLLLATLRSADKWLQLALGVSPNVILIMVAILLLAVTCRFDSSRLWPGMLRRLRMISREPPPDTIRNEP